MPPVTPSTFHRPLPQSDLGPDEPAGRASDWIRKNNSKLNEIIDVDGKIKTVTVSNKTLENLRLASKVNRQVKRVLPFGSVNMELDLAGTKAENWVRIKGRGSRLRVQGQANTNFAQEAEKILKSGVGNCGEHADIAFDMLTRENLTEPVTQVQAKEMDHAFVIIGDLAGDPAKCVVVDPWLIVPIAHTLDQGRFTPGKKLRTHSPGDKPIDAPDPVRSALMTPQEVSSFRTKREYPANTNALYSRAMRDPLQKSHYWNVTSTPTPKTVYVNPDNSDRFDADKITDDYAALKTHFLQSPLLKI